MVGKILLAATFCLMAIQPVLAGDLVRDVQETLYRPAHHGLFSGLVGQSACGVITQSAVLAQPAPADSCGIETQAVVLAPAGCQTAILTSDPSDLDIRREQLSEKLNCLSGRLTACQFSTLNAAMLEINNGELAMRSDGYLSNFESRRLYRAMDQLASSLDSWAHTRSGSGSYIGLNTGLWY